MRSSDSKQSSPGNHRRSVSEDNIVDFMRLQESCLVHDRREELCDKSRYFIDSGQNIAMQDVDQPRVHPDKVWVPHCPSIEFPPRWEISDFGLLDEP